MLRTRQFLSEEGHPVTVSLDFPGTPFAVDCGNDGSYAYVHAHFVDEQSGNEIWGVYEIDRLANPDYLNGYYYPDHDDDGRLKLDNFRGDRGIWLSAATVGALIAFASSGGTPVQIQRGRLAALAS